MEKVNAFEAVITVKISALDSEELAAQVANGVFEHLSENLDAVLGDMVITSEVWRYDPDNPDDDGVCVWPTADCQSDK